LFGIYEPRSGAGGHNLLSEGIVNRDGSPGPDFVKAAQRRAEVHDLYEVMPRIVGTYGMLAQPGTTHAVGLPRNVPDQRFPGLLPNGPFQITKHVGDDEPVGDPVHRFFQMWQQFDGGQRDLFVWVAETSGESSQTAPIRPRVPPGAVEMGFYNMAAGDAPYSASSPTPMRLATITIAGDGRNRRQFSDARYRACHCLLAGRALARPPVKQIENPNPRPGTNNWYAQSGYSSGSYTKCADESEPGIAALHRYLATLPYPSFNNDDCEPGGFTSSTTTTPASYPLANRRHWDRRCFASRPKRSRRSPRPYRERG
jgi:hypothetical protein